MKKLDLHPDFANTLILMDFDTNKIEQYIDVKLLYKYILFSQNCCLVKVNFVTNYPQAIIFLKRHVT